MQYFKRKNGKKNDKNANDFVTIEHSNALLNLEKGINIVRDNLVFISFFTLNIVWTNIC